MRSFLLLVACQSATTASVDLGADLARGAGDLFVAASDDLATRDLATTGDLATAMGTLVFQCAGIAGGVCTVNADGSNRQTLLASGRAPERNAAGDILFHDDSYTVQKRDAAGTVTPLSAGAFPSWSNGGIVFQCDGLGGGVCTMNADGSNRQSLLATGRQPQRNAAGDILFHDDSYTVQKRSAGGTVTPLGAGVSPKWSGAGIVFQCAFGGGVCTMDAGGSNRQSLVSTGRSPDRDAGGDIVYHDDSYTLQLRRSDGTTTPLGAGAFARWSL
jgi:hypothetical protein